MLKIRLQALEHPTPDKLNYEDRHVFASTILWLEDQKIRTYKIEDREHLRQVDNLEVWEPAYLQYKKHLNMPQFESALEDLTWLLNYAIRLEFLDSPEKYQHINADEFKKASSKAAEPRIECENFYDNMDFNHPDFIAGVRCLADKLQIPHHPNHLLQLEAAARIVNERLSPNAKDRKPIVGTAFPFEKGNDVVAPSEDKDLDYPIRILRLLQIQSLRELQTRINETIVAIQDVTADPKTDSKLGKVGY